MIAAAKKIADTVAALFSEESAARQAVEKAQVAVTEAQQLFDTSPNQAAGEALMARKRDLEHAKLFVDRAQRLGREQQAEFERSITDAKHKELASLDAVADEQAVCTPSWSLTRLGTPETPAMQDALTQKRGQVGAVSDPTDQASEVFFNGCGHVETSSKVNLARSFRDAATKYSEVAFYDARRHGLPILRHLVTLGLESRENHTPKVLDEVSVDLRRNSVFVAVLHSANSNGGRSRCQRMSMRGLILETGQLLEAVPR